jgi:hypothetical protein
MVDFFLSRLRYFSRMGNELVTRHDIRVAEEKIKNNKDHEIIITYSKTGNLLIKAIRKSMGIMSLGRIMNLRKSMDTREKEEEKTESKLSQLQ